MDTMKEQPMVPVKQAGPPMQTAPVAPAPVPAPLAPIPATPIPSATPELEQVLVKIQELEQRIGELELGDAEEAPEESGMYEKFIKEQFESVRKSLLEELKGIPEIKKGEEKEKPSEGDPDKVPDAQTSDIHYDQGGKKTGAPVAGKETGLDEGKPSENDAISKVPKPKSEYPKNPYHKNAVTEGDVPTPGAPTKNPVPMHGVDGGKVPDNKSDGEDSEDKKDLMKEQYNYIQKKLSERQSVVSMHGEPNRVQETYPGLKDDTTSVIMEYLQKAKVRI